ncbi:hypothetical protein KF707_06140 [Candidatus Obscuribacterales bacterium]|nr:hypothetical protein [Candidatus Obscuribacterales bacterium]MBX3135796.1 hypothetical protein [Candidatus Obscuribacterales bacterium]MBX3153162.1 hypothetical protein [Candidatus Obscuribacterales bacterium]
MDGQDKNGTQAPKPDASETILQDQRGDKTQGQPTDAAEAAVPPPGSGQPVVDMASPESARTLAAPGATDTQGLNRATVDGDSILFTDPAAAKPGESTVAKGNEEIVVDPARGALKKVEPAPSAEAPPEGTVPVAPGADKAKEQATAGDTVPPAPLSPESALNPEYSALKPADGVKLPDAVEKEIQEKMAEFQKKLEGENYSIQFAKGEGPWGAITRQQQEAAKKQKEGKTLTPQEEALLKLDPDQVTKEAREIRDRDFKVLKDKNGNPRNWYIVGEPTSRWSPEQMKEMMAKQEQALRQSAEAAVKEAEARAEAERQAALAAKVEKNVPAEAIVKDAATSAGVEGDPKAIRDAMKAQVEKEVKAGTLTDADLEKPYPRVGAALVGTGALTTEELDTALAEQAKKKAEAADGKAPRLDAVLQEMFKDNPEKLAKLDKSSKFYDELKRLTDEAAKKQQEVPAPPSVVMDDPFAPQYTDLGPKAPTPPAVPEAVPAAPEAVPAAPEAVPAAPEAVPAAPEAVPTAPPAENSKAEGDPDQAAADAAAKRRAELLKRATTKR